MHDAVLDLARITAFTLDLPARLNRKLRGRVVDYRRLLFDDLQLRLHGKTPRRILEIGPRDGEDTRRLVTLGAERIVLVDLPSKKTQIDSWLPQLSETSVEIMYGNVMYDPVFDAIEPF